MFGDIVVTYEKMQEIDFSFFTLADNGAFLTHAPDRLSEAFALVYPFQMNVWLPLLFTIIIVGPTLYSIIICRTWIDELYSKSSDNQKAFYSMLYIKEITRIKVKATVKVPKRLKKDGLLIRCVWFTCHVFLKQCKAINVDRIFQSRDVIYS